MMIGELILISKQVISKILNERSYSLLEDYNVNSDEFFRDYENEYNFIKHHYEKYGVVPDKASFLDKFPDFSILDVKEPDRYLVDKLHEERLNDNLVSVVNNIAELVMAGFGSDATEYALKAFSELEIHSDITYKDLFADAMERFERFDSVSEEKEKYFVPFGIKELDDYFGGMERGEELILIGARTGVGKSWFLMKLCTEAAMRGERVGIVSPEMGVNKLGYRMDTIITHMSNNALVKGKKHEIDKDSYREYIEDISKRSGFIVATPKDFDNRITVSKLKTFIKQNKLTMLAVDGIIYIEDETGRKNDTRTIALGNIAVGLKLLSDELKLPIVVALQLNKDGEKKAELTAIRDSDAISHSATKVFMLEVEDEILKLTLPKGRDDSKVEFEYVWNIDKGIFKNVSQTDNTNTKEGFIKVNKNKFNDDLTSVF